MHEALNFDHLARRVDGISEKQIQAHLGLYKGYVAKLNEIWSKLQTADRSTPNYSFNEWSELKRREPVAYNGTLLHELYFGNLGGAGSVPSDDLAAAIARSFGTYDAWVVDLKAAAASSHGWVLLVEDEAHGKLLNSLVHSEHHAGLLAGTRPILAFDCWEHAYMIDFGTKKADYLEAFVRNIDWTVVDGRSRPAPARGSAQGR
jgi:Fe-Mn family superoxide dismutase